MIFRFSKKIDGIQPSTIREMLKLSNDPNIVPFSAGNPSKDTFPVSAIREITSNLLQENPYDLLQYGITEGNPEFRANLKELLIKRENINFINDEIIITTGSQQSIDLIAKALIDEEDEIICESPTFIGAINAFKTNGAKLVPIQMQDDGLDIVKLEQILKQNKKIKIIYTIPNFQNPTGITTSLKKRKAILNLATRYNVLIIEDDPYGELTFSGEKLPSIKSLDTNGFVAYLGSFSKTIAPGLRLGYTVMDNKLAQKFIILKQSNDVHTNSLSQEIANKFVTCYNYDKHIKTLRDRYNKKASFCVSCLEKYVKHMLEYNIPKGGFFIWCTLNSNINMNKFCISALNENNVALVGGSTFLVDKNDKCLSFRINFATPTDQQVKRGIIGIKNTINSLI